MDNFKFIYDKDDYLVCGEVKNKRLIEYIDVKSNILGNVYRANVIEYINSMESYVLNIGEEKNALLRKRNILGSIKLGDHVIVEVIKIPEESKMIEVSQKRSFSDGYLILLPYIMNNIKDVFYDFDYPYKLRTRAKLISNEEIKIRYDKLVSKYLNIVKEKHLLPTPKLIHRKNLLKDYFLDCDLEVISNKKNEYASIIDENFNPKYIESISLDLAKSRDRKVLINDIEIVIDRLEALTVIDINSKYANHKLNKEKLSLDVNFKSIEEIAIQIKLRKIKKMVIIDFLRMNIENKNQLKNRIKEIFNEYKIRHKIMGFSNMGLFEIIVY